jgi:probable phosphoglycerate mutase
MATILLVRHGENDWVKKNRLAGWIEGVHLNENGRNQAQSAAERISQLPIQALYSSPLERCRETAAYIAKSQNLNIIELEEIGEVHYGDWEGKKIEKLAKEKLWYIVQHYPSRMRFPNGEAMREVQFRAIQCLEKLATKHKDEIIVVVSHADVIKLILAHYLGTHIDLFQRISLSPASVSIIALPENGMVRVVRINDDGPLRPPPKPEEKKAQKEGEVEKTENKQKKTKKKKSVL